MPNSFDTTVRERLEGFGSSVTASGVATRFGVTQDDGIRLVVQRADGQECSLEMTGTTEVYLLDLGGVYRTQEVAYEPDEKLEALDGLLEQFRLYLDKRYVEEISERGGRVISRTLRFIGENPPPTITVSSGWLNGLTKKIGSRKSVIRPE
jgi:hypothetical protein